MGKQNGRTTVRKVYHGAVQVVKEPLVHVGRENLDFGKGFYVTDIRSL